MAQFTKKWISDDSIDGGKVKLDNGQALRGRNAADSADIDIIKIDASDDIILASVPKVGGEALAKVSDIPSTFEIQGNWDAATNSPTIASATNHTSDTYPLYIVSVAGSTTIDGQSDWKVGDKIYFANGAWHKADNNDEVTSVAGKSGAVTLDTDDLTEATNLFHTDARAKAAAVVDSTAGSETDQAASVSAMKAYVQGEVSAVDQAFGKEVITLVAQDITNGYVDLAQTPLAGSLQIVPKGGPVQEEGADYTVSGARVTFAGDLATLLAAGDKLLIQYAY